LLSQPYENDALQNRPLTFINPEIQGA